MTVRTSPSAPGVPSTTSPTAPVRPTPARMLALIATGAGGAAAVAISLAGVLDPGYSGLSEAISALASQESAAAPVMIVGFVAMAVMLLTSGTVLFMSLPGKGAKVGAVLVLLSGLMTVVVGLARQSCSSLQADCMARESAGMVSPSHWIHNLVSVPLFAFLVVAGFLWTTGLGRSTGSKRLARSSLVVAIAAAALFVWFGSGVYGTFGGLVERLLVWLAFGWPVYLSVRVTHSVPFGRLTGTRSSGPSTALGSGRPVVAES